MRKKVKERRHSRENGLEKERIYYIIYHKKFSDILMSFRTFKHSTFCVLYIYSIDAGCNFEIVFIKH